MDNVKTAVDNVKRILRGQRSNDHWLQACCQICSCAFDTTLIWTPIITAVTWAAKNVVFDKCLIQTKHPKQTTVWSIRYFCAALFKSRVSSQFNQ